MFKISIIIVISSSGNLIKSNENRDSYRNKDDDVDGDGDVEGGGDAG